MDKPVTIRGMIYALFAVVAFYYTIKFALSITTPLNLVKLYFGVTATKTCYNLLKHDSDVEAELRKRK